MNKRPALLLCSSLSLVVALFLTACGGGGNATPPPPASPPPVSVAVAPTSASVPVGATQQFTSTVSNTTNTTVTWQVNGVAGGNATLGTINAAGLYTAPTTVPNPAQVTVAAVSSADTSKSASAAVTVTPPPVSVAVSPTATSVVTSATQQFTATVTNATNTSVTWQVNGVAGGNATLGTISAVGLYTAPATVPNPAQVTVTAVSVADTTKSASATVTIVAQPISVSVSPATATVAAGATQQFTATVTNTANTSVTWEVDGVAGGNASRGTISAAGVYTAPTVPPTGGSVAVTAVSAADTSKSGSAAATLTFSNASFSGQYAFSFPGDQSGGGFALIGSLTADGNGTITAGTVDFNDTAMVVSNSPASGTFSVGADGRGTVSFAGGAGSFTFNFVVIDATRAEIISFSPTYGGSGTMKKQDPAAFDSASLNGNYIFDWNGADNAGNDLRAVGIFAADGTGAITSGTRDQNLGGTVTSTAIAPSTYSIAASGRGTAALVTPAGTLNFAVFVICSNEILMVSSDALSPSVPTVYVGKATKQQGASFNNASLQGTFVFAEDGDAPAGNVFRERVGEITANGSGALTSGVFDSRTNGVLSPQVSVSGAYAVAADGKGTATLNSASGTDNILFYMISASQFVYIGTDSTLVNAGSGDVQSGTPFTAASISGAYGFVLAGADASGNFNVAGSLSPDGAGAFTGQQDVSFLGGAQTSDIPITGTYTVAGAGHTIAITPSGQPTLSARMYIASSGLVRLISIDSTDFVGTAWKQF